MSDQIRAPWTPDQVGALNAFQQRGPLHPFMCGNEHPAHPDAVLEATKDGWRCHVLGCDYEQDWAHAFMADPAVWRQSPFGERYGPTPQEVAAALEQSPRTTVNNPPTSSGTPADTLRERIADAARTVHLHLGAIAIGMARGGDPIILSPSEANQVADAVLAAARNDLQQIQAASETAAEPQPAAHDAGPSVREAAADDRRWDAEREGE